MEPLRLYWPLPEVRYKGKHFLEAWAEEMAELGFDFTEDPLEADLAFFGSDSLILAEVLDRTPTIAYFWSWPPRRFLGGYVYTGDGEAVPFVEMVERRIELFKRCTMVLAPSFSAQEQAAILGIRTTLLIPGVDSKTLDSVPAPKERKHQIMYLGRLAEHKGIDALIQAMAMLQPPEARPMLLIAGPGDPSGFQRLATDLGVSAVFRGLSDEEKVIELSSSLMLAFPSYHEGFGLPPWEALYLGTPVIVAHTPHMRWMFKEWALYGDSSEELAEAIALVLNDPQGTMVWTASGQQAARETMTLKRAASDLKGMIQVAIKGFYGQRIRGHPEEEERIYDKIHRQNWFYNVQQFQPEWARHWRAVHFIKALRDIGAREIVDIGSGSTYPTIFAKGGFKVTAVEISPEAIRQGQKVAEQWGGEGITWHHGRAQDLPQEWSNRFDAVVIGELLEHVTDPRCVLEEAMRVVKPGGRVVATSPYGRHHFDPLHIGPNQGGWGDDSIGRLLEPWKEMVTSVEKIAEEGTEPSCYFLVLSKPGGED